MSSGVPGLVPGCSGAWTVKCWASASRNGFQWRPQGPWKKTRLGPEPLERTRMRTRPCQTGRVRAWKPFRVLMRRPACWGESQPPPHTLSHGWGRGNKSFFFGRIQSRPLPLASRPIGKRELSRALVELLWPPVVDPALVLPEAAERRQHFAGEEVHVLQGQLVGHGADLDEHHEVADAEALDHFFLEALADGGGAARDDVTLLDEVAVVQLLGILRPADGVARGGLEAAVVLIARRREPCGGDVEALVIEVLHVPRVQLLGPRAPSWSPRPSSRSSCPWPIWRPSN